MPILSENDPFIMWLLKNLGLPKNTVNFSLDAGVGKIVKITCEYYPDPGAETITKSWNIEKTELIEE